jgi:hypothetical protein
MGVCAPAGLCVRRREGGTPLSGGVVRAQHTIEITAKKKKLNKFIGGQILAGQHDALKSIDFPMEKVTDITCY